MNKKNHRYFPIAIALLYFIIFPSSSYAEGPGLKTGIFCPSIEETLRMEAALKLFKGDISSALWWSGNCIFPTRPIKAVAGIDFPVRVPFGNIILIKKYWFQNGDHTYSWVNVKEYH